MSEERAQSLCSLIEDYGLAKDASVENIELANKRLAEIAAEAHGIALAAELLGNRKLWLRVVRVYHAARAELLD